MLHGAQPTNGRAESPSWIIAKENDLAKAKILLVEDYPALRELFSAILKREHECCAVGSAEEAIELLNERDFNLVIVDLILPRMSGVELLKFVRRNHPALPVVMMSGGSARFCPEDFVRLGAIGFLEKPFRLHDLIASIECAISDGGK